MTQPLFKVLTAAEWTAFQRDGHFAGTALDLADGYIHLSASDQVAGVVQRHFAGTPGLVVLALDRARLDARLKWEKVRVAETYPHFYGPLTSDMVISADPVPDDPDQRMLALALIAV